MLQTSRSFRLLAAAALLVTAPLAAADWFVVAGASGGDGSRERPFHDPWCALAVAAAGDVVHVATGVYHGRHDRSAWVIDRPRITILGGYDERFERRDPWTQPSVFAFYTDYEGGIENSLLLGMDDHSGLVVDGVVVDGGGRNRYDPKPPHGLRGGFTSVGALVSFQSPDVVLRNCVLINSTTGGVELKGEGSRFENNVVLNCQGQPMLSLREPRDAKRPAVVVGNTFAFAWDESDPPMGRGGEKGTAIRVAAAARIEGNAFVACGNQAVSLFTGADRVAVERNAFWMTLRACVSVRDGGREFVIAEKNLEEMEDLGFQGCAGNRAADLGFAGLEAAWVDGVTRHVLRAYATPPKDAIAQLRGRYALGEAPPQEGDDFGPTAPYVAPAAAAALRVDGDAGARPVPCEARFAAASAARAVLQYARVAWQDLHAGAGLDGKPVEVRVAIGHERNGFLLQGITQDGHLGFDVMHPGGERAPERMHVFAVRNGAAHRQWQDAVKSSDARDAEDWYLIRGTARATGVGRQKVTIQVDAVVPTEAPERPEPTRPTGRDWYVRAGSSGGDGSRDKPYRDPFQALEKAGNGDSIHVAGGDYFGKMRSANWKVRGEFVSLLGGYGADFAARDPWANPTRLVMSPDVDPADRRKHSGEFLESEDVNRGLVVDGFVFDGASVNGYFDGGGGLNLRASPFGSLVQLRGPGLAVRNCVFANANGAAVDLAAASGTFENNVVVNTSGMALQVTAEGPGPWIVRDNTFLFAVDPTQRAGTGMSTNAGSLVLLRGRAAVRLERNVFGFADNYAVRVTVPSHKVVLCDNVFGANLYCHVTDTSRNWLHDATWRRRAADATFATLQGNALEAPAALAVDTAWLDRVLPRLFDLKGRYPRDAWVAIATAMRATVVPPAEQPVAEAVAEKPPEKPKEQSLEDLLAELDRLKADTEKPVDTAAPTGPPYAPAYDWKKAIELLQDPDQARAGARRRLAGAGR